MVEILVVVAVIVSLLALVVGMAQFANERSAIAQCDRDLEEIVKFLTTEYEDKGIYPPGSYNLNDYSNGNSERNAMRAVHEKTDTDYDDIQVGSRDLKIRDFWRKNASGAEVEAPDLPFRDPWGMDYVYIYPIPKNLANNGNQADLVGANLKRYMLGSRGPDRKLGSSDNVADYGNGDDITTESY